MDVSEATCRGETEELPQSSVELGESELPPWASSDHDQVDVRLELVPRGAEPFAQAPLEAIADDGIPDLSADGDTDSASGSQATGIITIFRTFRRNDDEIAGRTSTSAAQYAAKISGIQEAIRPPEGAGRPVGRHDGSRYLEATVAARRLRPFARRRFRIARPDLVFIRSRKPCLRRRLIRLGWNVRFIGADPHFSAWAILGVGGAGRSSGRPHLGSRWRSGPGKSFSR